MQPFSNQQLPFRYFDSDMAKKRPLVVSFRRIQKLTPNVDSCDSVSICDIHRHDTRMNDDNEAMNMKMKSKYGTNQWRIAMQKSGHCRESQSCRNFSSNDKQKSQLDSLFDENIYNKSHNDKGSIFPKEKFYGNAKLLLTMNDDILRTSVIDCDENSQAQNKEKAKELRRNSFTIHHFKDKKRDKNKFLFKSIRKQKLQTITSMPDDNMMIDEDAKNHREMSNNTTKDENRYFETLIDKQRGKKRAGNETPEEAFGKFRSSSAPSIFLQTKLSSISGKSESSKASFLLPKSVSMLKIRKLRENFP